MLFLYYLYIEKYVIDGHQFTSFLNMALSLITRHQTHNPDDRSRRIVYDKRLLGENKAQKAKMLSWFFVTKR